MNPEIENINTKVPAFASDITVTEEDGILVLLKPKFKNKWLIKWLLPKGKSPVFRIKLDAKGSSLCKFIDGQRNIQTILGLTQDDFKDIPDADHYKLLYLDELYKKQIITLL